MSISPKSRDVSGGCVQFGTAGQEVLEADAVFLAQGAGVAGEPAGHLRYRRRVPQHALRSRAGNPRKRRLPVTEVLVRPAVSKVDDRPLTVSDRVRPSASRSNTTSASALTARRSPPSSPYSYVVLSPEPSCRVMTRPHSSSVKRMTSPVPSLPSPPFAAAVSDTRAGGSRGGHAEHTGRQCAPDECCSTGHGLHRGAARAGRRGRTAACKRPVKGGGLTRSSRRTCRQGWPPPVVIRPERRSAPSECPLRSWSRPSTRPLMFHAKVAGGPRAVRTASSGWRMPQCPGPVHEGNLPRPSPHRRVIALLHKTDDATRNVPGTPHAAKGTGSEDSANSFASTSSAALRWSKRRRKRIPDNDRILNLQASRVAA